jgi:hypothetical protein
MRELPRDLTFYEVYPMDKEDIVLFIATHYFDEKKETYIDCIIGENADSTVQLPIRLLIMC